MGRESSEESVAIHTLSCIRISFLRPSNIPFYVAMVNNGAMNTGVLGTELLCLPVILSR